MSITSRVAQHIAGIQFGALAGPDVEATKNHILYTTGTVLAGAFAPGIPQIMDAARQFGAGDDSSVLVHGQMLPAASAALVNAAMAHSRELDINDDRIAYKTSVAVVPAAIAYAQRRRPVGGQDFIAAVAAGIDFGIRMGLAILPKPTHARFSALGPLASAAACARLANLDALATHNALGIAYCRSTLAGISLTSPSLTKRLAAGLAAQAGVMAAVLGEAGFPATTEILAGPEGFFQTLYRQEGDLDALMQDLGVRFEIGSAGAKPYPSCRFTHPAVEAVLSLCAKHQVKTSSIASIRVHVGRRDLAMVWGEDEKERSRRARPEGIVDAQFSIPYVMGAAIARRRLTLEEFTEEALRAQDILDVAGKVQPVLVEEFDDWPSDVRPQMVELVLTDGCTVAERVDAPKGSPGRSFSAEEIDELFRGMAGVARVSADSADRFIQGVRRMEASTDVAALFSLLS